MMFKGLKHTTRKPPAGGPDATGTKQGSRRTHAEIELARRDIMLACLENMGSGCAPSTADADYLEGSFGVDDTPEEPCQNTACGEAKDDSVTSNNEPDESFDVGEALDTPMQDAGSGEAGRDDAIGRDEPGDSFDVAVASDRLSQDPAGSRGGDYATTHDSPMGELPGADESLEELLRQSCHRGQDDGVDTTPEMDSGVGQDSPIVRETVQRQHSLASARAALANGDHPAAEPMTRIPDIARQEASGALTEADETGESLSLAEQIAAAGAAERGMQADGATADEGDDSELTGRAGQVTDATAERNQQTSCPESEGHSGGHEANESLSLAEQIVAAARGERGGNTDGEAQRREYEFVSGTNNSKSGRVASDGVGNVTARSSGGSVTDAEQPIGQSDDTRGNVTANDAEPARIPPVRPRGLRGSRPRKTVAYASLVDEIMTSIVLSDIAAHNEHAMSARVNDTQPVRNVKLPTRSIMQRGASGVPIEMAEVPQRPL